jgi:hypothetical protein
MRYVVIAGVLLGLTLMLDMPRAIAETAPGATDVKANADENKVEKIDDFIANLAFIFSDRNFLETTSRSPTLSISNAIDGSTAGFRLNLTKRVSSANKKLVLEGAYKARSKTTPDFTGNLKTSFDEDGSYLQITRNESSMAYQGTFFPYNSKRFAMGNNYGLRWGGESTFAKTLINKTNPLAGLKLSLNQNRLFNVYAGLKTRLLQMFDSDEEDSIQTQYGFLGGAGLNLHEEWAMDLNGGVFQKGTLRKQGVMGENVLQAGASGQVGYFMDYAIKEARDIQGSEGPLEPFINGVYDKMKYTDTLGLFTSVEGVYLTQNLQDPDQRESTAPFNGIGADAMIGIKIGYLGATLDYMYRNLEFLLFSVPGMTPFETFYDSAKVSDEHTVRLRLNYAMMPGKFILGGYAKLQKPATYRGDSETMNLVVVRDREDYAAFTSGLYKNKEILPTGAGAYNIFSSCILAEYILEDFISLIIDVSYESDYNDTQVGDSGEREFRPSNEKNRLGGAFVLVAKF